MKIRNSSGFSLIELVLIMILLGVIAISLSPLVGVTQVDLDSAVKRAYSDMIDIQYLAMATGASHTFKVTSSSSYQTYETVSEKIITGVNFTGALGKIKFQTAPFQVIFIADGSPILPSENKVVLTDGTNVRSINITANTGLIELK